MLCNAKNCFLSQIFFYNFIGHLLLFHLSFFNERFFLNRTEHYCNYSTTDQRIFLANLLIRARNTLIELRPPIAK